MLLIGPRRLHLCWLSMLACGSRSPLTATETNETLQGTEETGSANEMAEGSASTVSPATGLVIQTSGMISETGATSEMTGESGATGDLGNPEECTTWNDLCPEGEKCLPYTADKAPFQNSMGCFPVVADTDKMGDPCQPLQFWDGMIKSLDTCERGDFCWLEVCRPLCQGAPDSWVCPPGFGCLDLLPVAVCETLCDPLEPNCAQDERCEPLAFFFQCLPGAGDNQLFESCGGGDECAPGLYCAPPSIAVECNSECCNSLCELDIGQCPGMGQQCLPFYPPSAPPEYDNLGACVVPGGG